MTAEPDLLPCPWCGEKLASVSVSEGSTFRWRKVDGCCADGPEVRHNTMADDQEAAEVESRAAAIAAWNTRACIAHATAAKDAEIEALRVEVERVTCELMDAITRADKLAEALREIANQGPHYGPDGTYKTWRHLAEIARAALEQEAGRG